MFPIPQKLCCKTKAHDLKKKPYFLSNNISIDSIKIKSFLEGDWEKRIFYKRGWIFKKKEPKELII